GNGRPARAGHDLHHRTDDQRRQARHQTYQGRLDGRNQGPRPVGAVGAHRARHGHGLRGDDPLRGHAGPSTPRSVSAVTQPEAAVPAGTARVRARVASWKQRPTADRGALRERFQLRGSATELLRRHSALIDRLLKEVWAHRAMPRNAALAAVGGYGRVEQFPCSDVDLLILLSAPPDAALALKLEELIGTLWDIGLEVGHSVRTIEECVALAASDVTVQTTLLESRLLTGRRDLYARFTKRMRDTLDPAAFLQAKILEQQQRRARFAETSLEPNVKESGGG